MFSSLPPSDQAQLCRGWFWTFLHCRQSDMAKKVIFWQLRSKDLEEETAQKKLFKEKKNTTEYFRVHWAISKFGGVGVGGK